MRTVVEPKKEITLIEEVDICVLGGSCTGVFAAVRAARLGARVAIVERQNCFGGTATSSLVNLWHSLKDSNFDKQIIAGLTQEVIERLKRRNTVEYKETVDSGYNLNTEELKLELDKLVIESKVLPLLCTFYSAPYLEEGALKGVFIENKSGRGVILAKFFIDATGDGDLCFQLGMDSYTRSKIQPPTMCAKIMGGGFESGFDVGEALMRHREEEGIREDWGWRCKIAGLKNISMHAETHVFDLDLTTGLGLSLAEIEGRRQVGAIMNVLNKYKPGEGEPALVALPSAIGIRETRHVRSLHRITEGEILYGVRFEDAVVNGSYRVDIHHSDKPGITLKYLDGTMEYGLTGQPRQHGRWREDSGEYPTFWQLPYGALVPETQIFKNVLMAGRMIDADEGAFGAVRVMVNMNQMGEAAGVAAYIALKADISVESVSVKELRKLLKKGGSLVI